MRLIDADNVDYENIMCSQQTLHWLYGIIEEQPTVDAVPVVRCADCQHCALDYADQGFGYPTKPIRVCIIHDHETKLDDYCSWARRKDGADNE